MKARFAFAAAALLAGLTIAGEAAAAPAHAVVHGAIPIYAPPAYDYDDSNLGYGDYYGGFYGNPADRYYDPAGAMPDWRYYGPKPVDLVLGRTLSARGETMLSHMMICQARHATYNPATNMFTTAGGIAYACQD